MEYGTGYGYRENFISTENITMWVQNNSVESDVTAANHSENY